MLHAALAIFTEAVFWIGASRQRAFVLTLIVLALIWGGLMLTR